MYHLEVPRKKRDPFDIPLDRPLREEEFRVGPPTLEALRRDPRKIDDLNILQLNDAVKQMRILLQAAQAVKDIPANVHDFSIKYGQGSMKEVKHLRLVGEYLMAFEKPNSPHLCISMPPGCAKSTTMAMWYPIQFLAKNPKKHIAYVTNTKVNAEKWGRRVRNWIRGLGGQLGMFLDETSSAAARFDLKEGGGMESFGFDSAIAGKRFDQILVDDVFGGYADAQSKLQREQIWEKFLGDVTNRLDPGGKMAIIGTRFHEDDLIGRVLARGQEVELALQFDFLRLPALAEEGDELGREVGEALWEDRFGKTYWEQLKATYTPHMWSSVYQQDPTPEEGIAVNRTWFQRYTTLPKDFDVVVSSWDLTFGAILNADYTVGLVLGRRGPQIFVIDMFRKQIPFDEQIEAIRAMSVKWPMTTGKLIERAANGWAAVAMLTKEIPGVMPIPPQFRGTDTQSAKEIRLQQVLPYMRAGNIQLPTAAPWLQAFEDELVKFPGGRNDDIVDAFSQGVTYLMLGGGYASAEAIQRSLQQATPPKTTDEIQQRQWGHYVQTVMKREEKRINGGLPQGSRWRYPSEEVVTPTGEIV